SFRELLNNPGRVEHVDFAIRANDAAENPRVVAGTAGTDVDNGVAGFDLRHRGDLGGLAKGVAVGFLLWTVLVGDGGGDVVGHFGFCARNGKRDGSNGNGECKTAHGAPPFVSGGRTLLPHASCPKSRGVTLL